MKLSRHFFISDSLDDLERFERELESAGIVTPQIHVLTLEVSELDNHHHLHQVTEFMKRDVVNSTLMFAAIGVVAGVAVLILSHALGWTQSPAGWMPFIFLAIVCFGFITWEGGLRGIQVPNAHFRRFDEALRAGRHVFFVDVAPEQVRLLESLSRNHPAAEAAGTASGSPGWLVFSQHRLRRFFADTFP